MILKELSNSQITELIDEWIHSERDRKIMKRRFIDGIGHEKIARKSDFSDRDVEMINKLTDTIKNIDKIHMLDEDGYSGDGEWTAHGNYGKGNSYASRKRYSRDSSKEHMLSKLEDMMHNADSDRMKSAIRKCINEIERD